MRLSPSPGPFNTARYGYPWAMSYMLWFNILNPITMLAGVAEIQYKSRLKINFAINWLLLFANGLVFVSFLGIWIGYCNNGYSLWSPCDSPLNCCVNFGTTTGTVYCPTASGCTPSVGWSDLSRWNPFFISLLWSMFFFIYCFFTFSVNTTVKKAIRSQSDVDMMNKAEETGAWETGELTMDEDAN
jgi:hypothetical protein